MKKILAHLAPILVLLCLLPALLAGPALAAEGGPDFTQEELDYISSRGPLRVGYVTDRIPVSFRGPDGALAGISRYIFDRVSALTGLSFEYIPLPGGSITFTYLMDENIDLVTSVEYNPENLNARGIKLTDPYFSSRKVVVVREDLDFNPSYELTAAITSGSQTLRAALARTFPNFIPEDYDSITACFEAVLRGEADLLIQNQYVVEYWKSKPAYEHLNVIPVSGLDDDACFSAIFSFDGSPGPTEEDAAMLVSILNKAIGSLSEDEISSYVIRSVVDNQYVYSLSDILYRYRVSVAIFAASAVIILVLAGLLARQRIRSMAAQSDAKAKREFLSAMSHEIRTPLNGLIGLNYLMAKSPDDPERLRRYLEQSTGTARYLLRLLSDVLDMSSLRERQMGLESAPLDLNLALSTVEALVRSGMEEKGLEFTAKADLPCPWVNGDEVRIQQVLMNLLDNARKFTPSGGRVTLTAGQELREDGTVLTTVTVSDTGQGMSEEFQKLVFHSFVQERDTVSKGNQGTGLGLSISRDLARLMGGDITFTSQKDRGSDFRFTFSATPAAAPEPPAPAEPEPGDGKKPRVLVAEDNELNGEIMLELLEDSGFEADLARDGQEALEMFSASPVGTYGVILMDLLMPRLNGYESTEAIRALHRPDAKRVRIIACTANSFTEERERVIKSGLDDFISKPIDLDELLEKISY